MALPGEYEYYAGLSGLPADRTLNEHKLEYFRDATFEPTLNLDEAEALFYQQETAIGDTMRARFTYYAGLSGLAEGSLSDHMAAFFADPVVPPSGAIVGTFIGANGSVSDNSSYTFLAEPIGVAGATRRVVVGVCTRDLGGEAQPTSVTIGGIAATRDGTGSDETVWAEVWSAVVPTGTTANIVVTLPFTSSGCGIGVWSLDKGAPSGGSVGAGGAAVVPLVLTTEADDFVIAVVHDRVTVLGPSVAFASGTERYDTAFDGAVRQHAGADAVAAGASVDMTATITNFTVDSAGVAVGYRA